jgi:hypothetical protein
MTIYGEGDASFQPEATVLQLRGDQATKYIRFWRRTGDKSPESIGLNSSNNGIDYNDGEWHAAVGTIADQYGGSGSVSPPGTYAYVDGRPMTVEESGGLPYSGGGSVADGVAIGVHPSTTLSEPMDGDIALVVTWRRGLSQHECRLFSIDPFAMLRPVLRIPTAVQPPINTFEDITCPTGVNLRRASYPWFHPMILPPCPDGSLANELDRKQLAALYPFVTPVAGGPSLGSLALLGCGR